MLGVFPVVPTVLLISEDLSFIITVYASIQRDARIGQVEAAGSQDEGVMLAQTMLPRTVVLDVTASDPGQPTISRLRRLGGQATIIVTYRERDEDVLAVAGPTLGADDVCRRDALSVERILRALQARAGAPAGTPVAAGHR